MITLIGVIVAGTKRFQTETRYDINVTTPNHVMEIAIGLTAFITSSFNQFSTQIFKYLSYSCNRGFIDNNVEIVEVVDDSSKKEVRRATKCPLNLLFFEFFYEFKEEAESEIPVTV